MGIFQFKAGLEKYSSWADPYLYATGVHNSYGELFYGSGILAFLYFFWHFTIIPVKIYFLNFSRTFFSFLGIILIPFFESNLTGGQFLFYPWFISISVQMTVCLSALILRFTDSDSGKIPINGSRITQSGIPRR